MAFIKSIIKKIVFPHSYSSKAFIQYIKNKGVEIGNDCIIYAPNSVTVDLQRPHMLHIGNYCRITEGVRILTHDYSRVVLVQLSKYGNVGESGITYIGDNVFIGMNSVILMGSHIGNNSIVGAGAVVSGKFPDNVVIAGNPAKIVCTIDDFYKRRKSKELDAAKEFVKEYRRKKHRNPTIYEMTNSFAWLYLSGEEDFQKYEQLLNHNAVDKKAYKDNFLRHKAVYKSFEDFLKDCY